MSGRQAAVPYNLNRGKETVPTAGKRLNENGSIRRVTKRFTQTLDGRVQARIKVNKGVRRPKRRMKIFARDNSAGALKQLSEYKEGLILKAQLRAAFSEFPRIRVQFKDTETIAR